MRVFDAFGRMQEKAHLLRLQETNSKELFGNSAKTHGTGHAVGCVCVGVVTVSRIKASGTIQ